MWSNPFTHSLMHAVYIYIAHSTCITNHIVHWSQSSHISAAFMHMLQPAHHSCPGTHPTNSTDCIDTLTPLLSIRLVIEQFLHLWSYTLHQPTVLFVLTSRQCCNLIHSCVPINGIVSLRWFIAFVCLSILCQDFLSKANHPFPYPQAYMYTMQVVLTFYVLLNWNSLREKKKITALSICFTGRKGLISHHGFQCWLKFAEIK